MFWNRERETLSRDGIDALQLAGLKRLVERLSADVEHYREALRGAGPVRSLHDLATLPFTTKETLREHYPFGLLAVPREDIVRVHASSGTTGKPTVVAYTNEDMALWSEVMARVLTAAGVNRRDVVHNAFGYGLFTGGLGFGLGSETVGASTVPASGGHTKRHLMVMEDFGASVLCATPSYALVLAEAGEGEGRPLSRFALRVGIFGAEPWTDAMRREIETRLDVEAFDTYGLSEIIGPGVASECPEHDGLHIAEDHFLAEIVDPDSGEPLPAEAEGELVISTLTKRGLPLLRYRTRDRVRLNREPCACGRTTARMSKVLGRTDDMLIVRGVNVFPSQIEEALLSVDGLAPQYVIVVDRGSDRLDNLEVLVEASTSQNDERMRAVQDTARSRVQETLGIRADVRVVAPRALERSQGKAVRVKDQRGHS